MVSEDFDLVFVHSDQRPGLGHVYGVGVNGQRRFSIPSEPARGGKA